MGTFFTAFVTLGSPVVIWILFLRLVSLEYLAQINVWGGVVMEVLLAVFLSVIAEIVVNTGWFCSHIILKVINDII